MGQLESDLLGGFLPSRQRLLRIFFLIPISKDQFFYGLSLFAKHFLIFVSILVKSLLDRPGKGKR